MLPAGPLTSSFDGKSPVDRQRILDATRILGSKSGLYQVLAGCLVLSIELGDLWPKGERTLFLVFYFWAYYRWIPAYYEKRFGSVQTKEITAKQFAILMLTLLGLFLFSLFFGTSAQRYIDLMVPPVLNRLHLLLSDPGHQINLFPSVLWVLFFFTDLKRYLNRGARLGQLVFSLCGLLVFASAVFAPVWQPSVMHLGLWRVLNIGGLGLTLVALGIYDYLTLVLFLPKKIVEGDDE